MKVGMVVNNISTELPDYTTTLLAMNVSNKGHEIYYLSVDDFVYDVDEKVHARVVHVEPGKHRSTQVFLRQIKENMQLKQRLILDDLDILLLRNDPAEDIIARPWARLVGINFGRLAMRHHVIVLNDPNGLAKAVNKMYLQLFPETIRPTTLISRDRQEVKDFIHEQQGRAVLKPLFGSGGHNVFLLRESEKANVNQIIDVVLSEGYGLVQEYLPGASQGDTRLFLLNGYPLESGGEYAAIRRVRKNHNGDMRSNMSAGAIAIKANIDDDMLKMADIVGPKLREDGMFFVGLDIVGNKLMEINVFSPGGLDSASKFQKRNFALEVVKALEQEVETKRQHNLPVPQIKSAPGL